MPLNLVKGFFEINLDSYLTLNAFLLSQIMYNFTNNYQVIIDLPTLDKGVLVRRNKLLYAFSEPNGQYIRKNTIKDITNTNRHIIFNFSWLL